jgi:hypothetical protein
VHPPDRERMLAVETKRDGWRRSFLHCCRVLNAELDELY